jgi:hypothetical protein
MTEIVTYDGKRYQRRFAPARMSNSRKTVIDWARGWDEVE